MSAASASATRATVWALGLITAGLLGAQTVFYFARTVDDAFISLRYAENLLHGSGLVYNPGERVEGLSSPLWALLQALGLLVLREGVTATKLWSGASLGLLLWCAHRYGRRVLGLSRPVAWLTLGALAANSYVLSWGWLGLETPLYLALLLAWPLVLREHLATPSRRTFGLAVGCGVALGCTRPEASLYLATLLLGVALSRAHEPVRRRRLLHVAGVVAAALLGLELVRLAYFGALVPHTFLAKRGDGFAWHELRALVGDGAHPTEVMALLAGFGAALWLAIRRIDVTLLICVITDACFVASVQQDWMPNQRHVLPTWVASTLALAAAIEAGRVRRWPWRVAAGLGAVALVACGAVQIQIDSRFSPKDFRTHGRGQTWVRPKVAATWGDAWAALRRRTPPHVQRMTLDGMGMIQQLFRILEVSAAPEADNWYVGRDIGRVGYLSPVRIFDTDGLFTPDVPGDPEWAHGGRVSRDLARRAFARKPVAAEVYEAWSPGVGQVMSELGDYEVVAGSRLRPITLVRRGPRPSPRQILDRYARVARKLPSWFYPATVYGESVGAAIDKRCDYVRSVLGEGAGFEVPAVPRGLVGGEARFEDGGVILYGCAFSVPEVPRGSAVDFTCYFEATEPPRRDYRVFVHLVDGAGRRVLGADHAPCGGFFPMRDWPAAHIVRDRVEVPIPADLPTASLTAYVGLFDGAHRAPAEPPEKTDGQDRVVGPTVRIRNP
jgi:hypothetical protein